MELGRLRWGLQPLQDPGKQRDVCGVGGSAPHAGQGLLSASWGCTSDSRRPWRKL